MTTYYVRTTGDDSDDGLTPATAWLTIGKALGAAGISSGDTVYVGAGTYREAVDVAMTSAVAETFVIGDVDGVQTGDAGDVRWTNSVVDDTTVPTGQTLDLNGCDHLTFRRLSIVGGVGSSTRAVITLDASGTNSTSITFTDCAIRGLVWGGAGLSTNASSSWLFDRCYMFSVDELIEFAPDATSNTVDWDVGVVFKNCVLVSLSNALMLLDTSGGSAKPGGLQLLNCTLVGSAPINTSNWSTSIPVTITNCLIVATALQAGTAGEIVEDYNVFVGGRSSASFNVTDGAHSTAYAAPLFSLGDESVWGSVIRAFGMPGAGDPALAFGGSSPQALDILSAPRVAAFAAAGAYERGNIAAKETGTVQAGANAVSITGPGYQDFDLAVPASLTTINIYARFGSTYAGTKPKLQIINGTEAGVADASVTMTAAADTWERLSLSFTPTAAGIITVRVLSSDTDGGGVAFFDTFEVTYGAHVLGFNFRRGEPLQTLNGIIVQSPGITEAREGLV